MKHAQIFHYKIYSDLDNTVLIGYETFSEENCTDLAYIASKVFWLAHYSGRIQSIDPIEYTIELFEDIDRKVLLGSFTGVIRTTRHGELKEASYNVKVTQNKETLK